MKSSESAVAARSLTMLSAFLLAGAVGLVGCSEPPTTTAFEPPDPQFAKPCLDDPDHPSCGGDDGGASGDEEVPLILTLDDTGPAITSDGGGTDGAYVEGEEGVAAHFSSANGNLMFKTEDGPRFVMLHLQEDDDSDGVVDFTYRKLIDVHRSYTNQNINFTDSTLGTDVDLRTIDPGDDVTTAFYVEWNDPDTGEYFELRYGALCTEEKFDGDPTNDSHRVEVDRVDADTWIISSPPTRSELDNGGAVLCLGEKTGKSGKVTMSHVADIAPADAAFSMTLVRQK